ncbi:chorismate synthase [Candidatus Bipolaricaulota bacterium]|nr:chorismate synthase [Candidatus Bipolaricaulota bacterium]
MEITVKTAGESHGKGIIAMAEGFPSGLKFDEDLINEQLFRRQGGYGRGGRMEIESDEVEVLSGFYQGESLGTPIVLRVKNRDWENWEEFMSPEAETSTKREVTLPRPGHADLAGALKHGFRDCRRVLERTSARETAGRVAVGGLSRTLLNQFGVEIASRVTGIGEVSISDDGLEPEKWKDIADKSPVRVTDELDEENLIEEIERAKNDGDSLGGSFEVVASGAPPGLGSYSSPGKKLDARIGAGFMSIPAIKSVEVGLGKGVGSKKGSEVHDEIYHDDETGFYRGSNEAGGIEGGISNGEKIRVTATMKPIPTLGKPLHSVDLTDGEEGKAAKERSDVCAVPAASVVGEAEMANLIAGAFLDKFSGDTVVEVRESFERHLERLEDWYGGD